MTCGSTCLYIYLLRYLYLIFMNRVHIKLGRTRFIAWRISQSDPPSLDISSPLLYANTHTHTHTYSLPVCMELKQHWFWESWGKCTYIWTKYMYGIWREASYLQRELHRAMISPGSYPSSRFSRATPVTSSSLFLQRRLCRLTPLRNFYKSLAGFYYPYSHIYHLPLFRTGRMKTR